MVPSERVLGLELGTSSAQLLGIVEVLGVDLEVDAGYPGVDLVVAGEQDGDDLGQRRHEGSRELLQPGLQHAIEHLDGVLGKRSFHGRHGSEAV